MNSFFCPGCQQPLVEYLLKQGVALACPTCVQLYNVADFVADSEMLPQDIRQEASEIRDLFWLIGLGILGGTILATIFGQQKRRR